MSDTKSTENILWIHLISKKIKENVGFSGAKDIDGLHRHIRGGSSLGPHFLSPWTLWSNSFWLLTEFTARLNECESHLHRQLETTTISSLALTSQSFQNYSRLRWVPNSELSGILGVTLFTSWMWDTLIHVVVQPTGYTKESIGLSDYQAIFRVTTHLENLETSGNSKVVREIG